MCVWLKVSNMIIKNVIWTAVNVLQASDTDQMSEFKRDLKPVHPSQPLDGSDFQQYGQYPGLVPRCFAPKTTSPHAYIYKSTYDILESNFGHKSK